MLRDAVLAPDITPLEKTGKEFDPNYILLTGVTGFLGVHLLGDLIKSTQADVFCMIRDLETKRDSFNAHLRNYNFEDLIDHPRLFLFEGDFSLPKFGLGEKIYDELAEKIDVIYHCGAFVHHAHNYERLRESNSYSVSEVLLFASTSRNKAVHYFTTLGVVSAADNDRAEEDFVSEDCSHLNSIGYPKAKWVGERLLAQASERGFDVSVFRTGYLVGQTASGVTPNPKRDHFLRFLKACTQMGCGPADWGAPNYYPVDWASRIIIAISLDKEASGHVFNLQLPGRPDWYRLVRFCAEYLGNDISFVPNDVWLNEHLANVGEDNALYPLRSFYLPSFQLEGLPVSFKTPLTDRMMKKLSLSHPKLDREVFNRYFEHVDSWLNE